MKKWTALLLTILMLVPMLTLGEADPYEVTEPIAIEWWHTHEDSMTENIKHMLEQFHQENPLITVEPIYIGSYADMNERLISANAAGTVPALCVSNIAFPPEYGRSNLCEVLDPYIEQSGFDLMDFGEGLVASSAYEGTQICLPYLVSTQCLYYNKTAADAEGIEMPKTFDDLEAFLEKVTLFNDDGTTKRWGTVFSGWDYWYFEMLYRNNGVNVLTEDGEASDLNSEAAVYITTKIKEWIDKGYAYFAYGSGSSSTMRQTFWDGNAFSVMHTTSLYDAYVENASGFEVGMAWLPGGNDGETFDSEVGGAILLIPSKASQAQKNAGWKLMQFMVSPEINLYWADQTGYFPIRQSLYGTPEIEEYLSRKPAMETVMANLPQIQPPSSDPRFDMVANLWPHALAKIFIENAPIQQTLDELVVEANEILADL